MALHAPTLSLELPALLHPRMPCLGPLTIKPLPILSVGRGCDASVAAISGFGIGSLTMNSSWSR